MITEVPPLVNPSVTIMAPNMDALDVLFMAARQCYTMYPEHYQFQSDESKLALIRTLIKRKHTSPLEHVSFTFKIESVPLYVMRHLVRHRIASWSETSFRHIEATVGIGFHVPLSMRKSKKTQRFLAAAVRLYEQLRDEDIPKEDARTILPMALCTSAITTRNCRELLNLFEQRMHKSAQQDTRDVVTKMHRAVSAYLPIFGTEENLYDGQ